MRDIEYERILNGESLNLDGLTTFGRSFPLGLGWYKANLRFTINLTHSAGSTVIEEGLLNIVKNVFLRTDRGEILCNIPGRGLYKMAQAITGTPSQIDTFAATTGTYYVTIPIIFADPMMLRPEDTILDTARYNSLQLQINFGNIGDLLSTTGGDTITATLEMEIMRTKLPLGEKAQPIYHVNYFALPTADPNSVTFLDVERAQDLLLKRLLVHTSASGTAGSPFTGTNADDEIADLSLQSEKGYIVNQRTWAMIQNENKEAYSLESVLSGFSIMDFVRDKSIMSALWTGDKARLQVLWTNGTVTTNDLVSVGVEGIRTLK
jgi:hypothetical protein